MKKIVKYCAEKLIYTFHRQLAFFFNNALGFVLYNLNKCDGDFFYTYHKRPANCDAVHYDSIWAHQDEIYSSVAIVIQGPIVTHRNFTIETVRLYKKLFKGVNIIVSTWNDVSDEMVDMLNAECHLILLDKPNISGSHNFNYQKKSTLAGIEYAISNLNCEYTLKTRTDHRFYSENTVRLLLSIIRKYSPKVNNVLEKRIIELSLSVCKFRPWSMCDMFQFGKSSDLLTIWKIDDDIRSRTAAEFANVKYKVRDIVKENVAEIYLHHSLAEKIGITSIYNYADYYQFIRDYFYIIDKEAIDLFWYKYNAEEYNLVGSKLYTNEQLLSMFKNSDFEVLRWARSELLRNDIDSFLDKYEN